MQAIIVSKNRAFQLDALLQSIDLYAPNLHPYIIYKYDSDFFKNGYDIIKQNFSSCIWIEENGFKNTILSAFELENSKCICMLTDDSIFYNNLNWYDDILYSFFKANNCWTFSPRCGLNTKQQCHWHPIFQKEINPISKIENTIIWSFKEHDYSTDYGRPISIDGNINCKEILYNIMLENEWNWCGALDGLPTTKLEPYMASYIESILVNIPINSTHGKAADNWGKFIIQDFEKLNSLYLDGCRANLQKMNFNNIVGGHQEIEYII